MPRPRFHKLPPARQARILTAAAQALAAHGYQHASLNQVLAAAGVSKGAAYYYFDDKADLFATAVAHCARALMGAFSLDLAAVTAATYWDTLAALFRHQFAHAREQPWVFGAVKAAGTLPAAVRQRGALADMGQEMQGWLEAVLQRGQAVGAVRRDLPPDLLLALVGAIDEAHDQWLLAHVETLAGAGLDAAVARVIDILRRLLAPVEGKKDTEGAAEERRTQRGGV